MKTPRKPPRQKSAVGKALSKSEGTSTSKSGPRRTNGCRKVDHEKLKVIFAGRVLQSPGKCIPPGEDAELSEDELGAITTTVALGIRDAREFANKDGTTESAKRKLVGVNSGADGEPVHGECTYEEWGLLHEIWLLMGSYRVWNRCLIVYFTEENEENKD